MNNFFITTKKVENISSEQVITKHVIATALEMLEDHESKCLTINAESYSDVKFCTERQVSFIFDGNFYATNDVKDLMSKAKVLFLSASDDYEIEEAYSKLSSAILYNVPYKIREEEAINILNGLGDSKSKSFYTALIIREMEEFKNNVQKSISISDRKEHFRMFEDSKVNIYKQQETADFICNNKGIHLLIGEKGTGKSELMNKIFKSEMENKNYPVMMNSSRALSKANAGEELSHVFYKNILSDFFTCPNTGQSIYREKPGMIGVVNSVLMNEGLKPQLNKSKTAMIDEIEDLVNHCTGDAVGLGKLQDKVDILAELERFISISENVILTDAMMSHETLDYILSINKKLKNPKVIYSYDQASEFEKPVINIVTQEQNIDLTNKASLEEKVAVFCDGKHSKEVSRFNAVVEMLKPESNKFSVIDACFMNDESNSDKLKNMDQFSKDNDIIFYNSAAKCGLSIVDQDYKTFSSLLYGTVNPNDSVQASRRPRPAKKGYVSFESCYSNEPTTQLGVLYKIMLKELGSDEITIEKQNELMSNEYVRKVIKRIAYKNSMKKNYANTVITMYKLLGYEVNFVEKEEESVKNGRAIIRKGKESERDMRRSCIINAEKIDSSKASFIYSNLSSASNSEKNKLEAYEISNTYNVDDIDMDLLKFDSDGKGRTIMSNMYLSRNVTSSIIGGKAYFFDKNGYEEILTNSMKIRKLIIDKFFSLTCIDRELYGSYTAKEGNLFNEAVANDELQLTSKYSIKMSQAISQYMPELRISNAMPAKTISSFLKSVLGLKTPKAIGRAGRGGSVIYEAVQNPENEKYFNKYNKNNLQLLNKCNKVYIDINEDII